MYLAE